MRVYIRDHPSIYIYNIIYICVWRTNISIYYPQWTWQKWVVPYRLWRCVLPCYVWKYGMGKWVAPYRLWRFSHKFEHPKSTPYYFSFPIILSVAHVIILYTHNPGTDLGTVARAQVHQPVTYFENCSLQTGHKEKYPEWYESRNCSLESERVFLFFFCRKKTLPSQLQTQYNISPWLTKF